MAEKDITPFGDLWKHNDYIKILQFKIHIQYLTITFRIFNKQFK